MTDGVQVDATEVEAMFRCLKNEDIPRFRKDLLGILALEGRGLMVAQTTSDHNQITGRTRTSIDAHEIPDGYEIGPSVYWARWLYGGWKHFPGTHTHETAFAKLEARAPAIIKSKMTQYIGGEVS